ncbi:sensor domain-containing protein [Roseospira goensis]|uniref:Diguanylate cyclase (GGDEF)-like protein/PAS domain S-box-containing protein n=1 Tax=Roseospira goensis TaxID=391922 RepID=A0A7W6RY21_9PROT|nr:PAS domain S-box protein [Roseospira goensis]MBB4285349.1 diguanylate cyclase (GGDEF)-like protein/PAS domain S-box-containing protein [Roseospira goensis]
MASLVPDMLCLCDADDHVVEMNPAGLALLGAVSGEAVQGQPFARFIHRDFEPLAVLGLEALADEPEGLSLILCGLDGGAREVHVRARRVAALAPGGPPGLLLHARDVTAQIRAVEGLLASEARFRSLVERAFSFVCVLRDGRVAYMNGAGRRLLRLGESESIIGRSFATLLHADYAGVLDLGLEALTAEPDLLPVRMLAADGAVLDVEARFVGFGGEGAGTVMVEARDITDRKRAAQALRDREQRLKGILDSVSEAIVTTDGAGIIQSFNPAAQRLFGYAADEIVGRRVADLVPDEHVAVHEAHFRAPVAGCPGRALGVTQELEGRRKDGSRVPIEIGVTRLNLGGGVLITGIIRDITERRRREEAERRYTEDLEAQVQARTREVRRLGRRTELILKSAGDGIIGVDEAGVVTFANPQAERLLGVGAAAMRGRALESVFHVRDRDGGPPAGVAALLAGDAAETQGETTVLRQSGPDLVAEYAVAPITDDGRCAGAVVMLRDVTARKEFEQRLRLAFTVFRTTAEAIVVCDPGHAVTMVNPAFTQITGHAERDVIGRPVSDVLFDRPDRFTAMVGDVFGRAGTWSDEFWHRRADGSALAVRLVATAVRDDQGEVRNSALVVSDITQRKRDEERIHYQAHHDPLTGLANRTMFMDVLARAVHDSNQSGCGLALMFLDLDGFKSVNDTLGHDAGDLLLKGAAQRIAGAARQGDTVARLGGDEFTVLLPGVAEADTAARVAARILRTVSAPYGLKGQEARISTSIGVAMAPGDGTDAETLLRHADAAMYGAKAGGKGTVHFHGAGAGPHPDTARGDAARDV